MIKPVIWTVIAAVTMVLAFMSKNGGFWAYVIAAVAAACAVLQWLAWRKNHR